MIYDTIHINLIKYSNVLSTGNGIGGFVGGQLVDGLGISLPLLFKITAGFLVFCVVVLGGVYNVFCKKYEERLVEKKEEDILAFQQNMEEEKSSKKDLDNDNEHHKKLDAISKLSLGNAVLYPRTQVAGISRL